MTIYDHQEMGRRSIKIEWEDPTASYQRATKLSGIEYLTEMLNAELPPPPIAALLNAEGVEVEEGKVVIVGTPGPQHYNAIGMVHATFAAGLLDSAMASAVHSTLPVGWIFTTLEFKLNFTRPILADTGRLLCEGAVINRGRTIATAEGKITSEETGKLFAHGTTTCLLQDLSSQLG